MDKNWRACFLNRSSHDTLCEGGFVGNIAMRSCPEMRGGMFADVDGSRERGPQSAGETERGTSSGSHFVSWRIVDTACITVETAII